MSAEYTCVNCWTMYDTQDEADFCCACEECIKKDKRIEELETVNVDTNKLLLAQIDYSAELESQLFRIDELRQFDVPHAPIGSMAIWVSDLQAILEKDDE